jgi:hypothetical protein
MTANDYYRWAESICQLGDFERSLRLCENALRCDPRHAAATALWTELIFILGRGGGTAASPQARLSYFESMLEEGRRQLFLGQPAVAEDYAERACRVAETLPPEMDVELRLRQVRALLDWIRACEDD